MNDTGRKTASAREMFSIFCSISAGERDIISLSLAEIGQKYSPDGS